MKLIDKTTIKFILVGIVNTLVGTGVMFLMYNLLHASYWISSASNYIIGSIVSYVLNKYFTFIHSQFKIETSKGFQSQRFLYKIEKFTGCCGQRILLPPAEPEI